MMLSHSFRPLTFILASTAIDKVELQEAAAPALGPAAWEELATSVAREPSLTPFPAETLRARWEQGHAAVVIHGATIVAYHSVLPVFGDATRRALASMPGVPPQQVPTIDLYESMTGWTAPALRKRGVSLRLRRPLFARFAGPDCLFIAFTAGMGASPVLSRMGWQIAPWSQIRFVSSSIIENPTAGGGSDSPRDWRIHGLEPYDGPPTLTYPDTAHDWSAYCYFWVSDADLAQRLDHQLASLVGNDLSRWCVLWGRVVENTLLSQGWIPIFSSLIPGADLSEGGKFTP